MQHSIERLDSTEPGSLYYQHLSRYDYALSFVKNRRVLDSACGIGYGTYHMLKNNPELIVGVDLSPEAIHTANSLYQSDRLHFIRSDCRKLPVPDRFFDVVTSFEFIEHIIEQEAYLRELDRVLKPGGIALISTPNATHGYTGNPYHLKELTLQEFRELLGRAFSGKITLYGQQFRESLFLNLFKYLDIFNLRRFLVPYGHKAPKAVSSSRYKPNDGSYRLDDFVVRRTRVSQSFVLIAVIQKAD